MKPVKCRNPSTPSTPLSEILSYRFNTIKSSDGADQLAPFVNAKYRSNVRVVDFWPHKLEDFALGRRVTEYDMLSDFSGGESTDNEGDMAKFREGKGFGGEKKWEWRFALQVEDVTKNNKERRERIWLMVNHENAQALLKLDDATKYVLLMSNFRRLYSN
jgi:protection-of-telomeres protein 1